ncbi:MAG: hypothetical protein EHM64_00145 [Ignavibacteriae bacterium]|nr:MAG: hypothetical protein EHM64_00145 [Ignavibacteriota bacterium]
MNYYHDFTYVQYIMDLNFVEGYTLYSKCIERMHELNEKELKANVWDLYLLELEKGICKYNTFDEYYNSIISNSQQSTMSIEDKNTCEQNIINRINKLDDTKLKRKVSI